MPYSSMKRNMDKNDMQQQVHETGVQHPLKCTVTHHALQYAVHYQPPSLKLICQPQVKDHVKGTD